MDVPGATQTPPASSASNAAAARASLDYDAFLRLLVAQMKNQDPTEPMDPTQYMAQLASFSSVEQAIQTNSKLDSLLMASSLSQADAVLGRIITSPDGGVSGKVESLRITSGGLVATLENGDELVVGEGIRISGE
jgi:flagellar basal-body rod modification protein FlgD